MKKVSFAGAVGSFFFWSLVVLAEPGYAQVTLVKLQNSTARPIVGQVGTSEQFVPAGESAVWSAGSWLFSYGTTQLTVTAQICDGVRNIPIASIPAWAASDLLPQGIAISEEYLATNPSEKELKRRVDEIKKFLDVRQQIGRKEMKKELDRWFKIVRKNGFWAVVRRCSSGPYAQSQTIYANSYNYNRQVLTLFVRENPGNGYYVSWY